MDDGVKPAAKRNGTPRTIVRKGRSPFRGLNCLLKKVLVQFGSVFVNISFRNSAWPVQPEPVSRRSLPLPRILQQKYLLHVCSPGVGDVLAVERPGKLRGSVLIFDLSFAV